MLDIPVTSVGFSLRDTVKIKALNCQGDIVCIQHNSLGTEYRVVYWMNGERKDAWVFGKDLEAN